MSNFKSRKNWTLPSNLRQPWRTLRPQGLGYDDCESPLVSAIPEFAEKIGYSSSFVTQYEKGSRTQKHELIEQWAAACGHQIRVAAMVIQDDADLPETVDVVPTEILEIMGRVWTYMPPKLVDSIVTLLRVYDSMIDPAETDGIKTTSRESLQPFIQNL